jgi:hypothetical protein
MSNEIQVKVASNGTKRRYLMMYYDCPRDGKRHWRSTRKTVRREAEKEAGKWEAELREGRYQPPSSITWREFRLRYEEEVASNRSCMAARTEQMIGTVFNAIERICRPQKLNELDAVRLGHFRKEIRNGRSAATAKTYLAHIMSALAWAAEPGQGLLNSVPKIAVPKRERGAKRKASSKMKGRPITGEEFERMLAKVEAGLIAASKDKYADRKVKWRINEVLRKRLDESRLRRRLRRRRRGDDTLRGSGCPGSGSRNRLTSTGPDAKALRWICLASTLYSGSPRSARRATRIDCYQSHRSSPNSFSKHRKPNVTAVSLVSLGLVGSPSG